MCIRDRVSGVEIADFADLKEALLKRMEFFAQMGCSVSDHALEYVMYAPAAEEKVNEIFKKRLNGESISREEEMIFKTAFMQFVGKEYHKKNWVMQILSLIHILQGRIRELPCHLLQCIH